MFLKTPFTKPEAVLIFFLASSTVLFTAALSGILWQNKRIRDPSVLSVLLIAFFDGEFLFRFVHQPADVILVHGDDEKGDHH